MVEGVSDEVREDLGRGIRDDEVVGWDDESEDLNAAEGEASRLMTPAKSREQRDLAGRRKLAQVYSVKNVAEKRAKNEPEAKRHHPASDELSWVTSGGSGSHSTCGLRLECEGGLFEG